MVASFAPADLIDVTLRLITWVAVGLVAVNVTRGCRRRSALLWARASAWSSVTAASLGLLHALTVLDVKLVEGGGTPDATEVYAGLAGSVKLLALAVAVASLVEVISIVTRYGRRARRRRAAAHKA